MRQRGTWGGRATIILSSTTDEAGTQGLRDQGLDIAREALLRQGSEFVIP
jgi:hypothetical protein